ncbi:MAG TPA: IclR family transcriptional regulator C-terminal domain-containing protein [Aldersonia sp.]
MSPLRDPTRRHPTAVSNSLRIIETVAVLGFGASAQEIATRLELPQATAYRLLNNLVGEEYLVRTADLRGFGLGRRLAELIGAVSQPMLGSAARAELDALRGSVRFAVHVVVFQADALRVLDADPDHPVRAERELIRHLHASAAGKLALAARTEWTRSLPAKPARLTPQTVTNLAALAAELDEVRTSGLAVARDELEAGLACVAVSILDSAGVPAGALCLAGSSDRTDALLAHQAAARDCARALGPLLF